MRTAFSFWMPCAALLLQAVGQPAALFAQATGAPPEVAAVRLELTRDAAASQCPDAAKLQSAVAARLGYVPFDEAAAQAVRVGIRGTEQGLAAELRIAGRDAGAERVRTLEAQGRACDDLTEALVLAIGLAIDPLAPSRTSHAAAADPTPTPTQPAAVPSGAAAPAAPEPAAEPSRAKPEAAPREQRLRIFVAVAPYLVLGAEPGLSGGALVSAGVRSRRASLGIEGRFDAAQSTPVEPQGEVQVGMRGGGLLGCFHHGLLALCGITQLLAVEAKGSGASDPQSAVGLLVNLGARIGVEWQPLSSLWVRPALEVQIATGTIELVWLGETVWQTSRAQGLLTLAVGVNL